MVVCVVVVVIVVLVDWVVVVDPPITVFWKGAQRSRGGPTGVSSTSN